MLQIPTDAASVFLETISTIFMSEEPGRIETCETGTSQSFDLVLYSHGYQESYDGLRNGWCFYDETSRTSHHRVR